MNLYIIKNYILMQKKLKTFTDNVTKRLGENKNQYDALVMIICGHGDREGILLASDGGHITIDNIRTKFDGHHIKLFQNYPKLFIINTCRGESRSDGRKNVITRGLTSKHNDTNFVMLWSTTNGYKVDDTSYFSKVVKDTIISNYKDHSLQHMLQKIRADLQEHVECYCPECETTTYDIFFEAKKI
ncbi:caspase 8-like protein [Reticulomyxa filosa]|uniref:Caspase 8-like protein n=1 Tax=Reticulomyxa filosa TaxID=46433 RepID=X6NID0_RETFI|nr:caspase 8-like protein [Reticulomyxa filosa]|eukprot:ETO25464.1 caspase 8-like protein [Reticulomyxa filosa]